MALYVHIHGKLDIEVYVAEMAKEVVQDPLFFFVGGGGTLNCAKASHSKMVLKQSELVKESRCLKFFSEPLVQY
jgi:hypothetical protein